LELARFLTDATLEVFASMVFIEITTEASPGGAPESVDPELSSLIGLAGDLKGFLAIHCPAPVALAITSSMLGMEVTELNEDVKDAIGEIANMIAGGLKVSLANDHKKIELAIPTTVIGKSIRTSGLAGATKSVVLFTSPVGKFVVELRFVAA
jgi:chemotaxis protein CheX